MSIPAGILLKLNVILAFPELKGKKTQVDLIIDQGGGHYVTIMRL